MFVANLFSGKFNRKSGDFLPRKTGIVIRKTYFCSAKNNTGLKYGIQIGANRHQGPGYYNP